MCQIHNLLLLLLPFTVSAAIGRKWILPTTTKAEMWNLSTWLTPYFIAMTESIRDYFTKAQEIQNQLYLRAQASNAFSWLCPWNWFKKPKPEEPESGVQNVTGSNNTEILPEGATSPSKQPSKFPTRPVPIKPVTSNIPILLNMTQK